LRIGASGVVGGAPVLSALSLVSSFLLSISRKYFSDPDLWKKLAETQALFPPTSLDNF